MIKKLPDSVIARISAGEVVARPYNILKETLENSLDAGCTHIAVRIGADGLSLEIEDDGCGIAEEDLPLLCRPHCTSKLAAEADLFALASYGFRGEALSSISRCSKIKVRTKRAGCEMGFEATYNDTELVTVRGVGMKGGTVVEVRDVFYNNKIRERYFCRRREETGDLVDLVCSYAIFRTDVAFEMSIGGKPKDLFGQVRETGDILKKARMLETMYSTDGSLLHCVEERFSAVFSGPDFSLKKGVFVLFVNGRLVTSQTVRESLFRVYRDVLPVQRHPLIYLELRTDQSETDVNVHPCKKEVLFAGEDALAMDIAGCIEARLRTGEYTQKPLRPTRESLFSPLKVYSDPTSQSIAECMEKPRSAVRSFCLESLERLRSEIVEVDSGFFRSLTYVGERDCDTMLVQHGSALLNCKTRPLLREWLYQSILQGFGNLERRACLVPTENLENLSAEMRAMLDDYFSIEVDGGAIVNIPVVSGVCVDDRDAWTGFCVDGEDEYSVLKGVSERVAEMYSGARMSQKLFGAVKRGVVGTESALRCFGLVVTLKELYKNFERC